jgi:hypothetical protein
MSNSLVTSGYARDLILDACQRIQESSPVILHLVLVEYCGSGQIGVSPTDKTIYYDPETVLGLSFIELEEVLQDACTLYIMNSIPLCSLQGNHTEASVH